MDFSADSSLTKIGKLSGTIRESGVVPVKYCDSTGASINFPGSSLLLHLMAKVAWSWAEQMFYIIISIHVYHLIWKINHLNKLWYYEVKGIKALIHWKHKQIPTLRLCIQSVATMVPLYSEWLEGTLTAFSRHLSSTSHHCLLQPGMGEGFIGRRFIGWWDKEGDL